MPRVDPLPLESLPADFRERMKQGQEKMGFRANDGLTFARVPGLMEGLSGLTWAIYGKDGLVTNELKRLVSIITSTASGCTYCQSHTVHGADMAGIDEEKIKAIWEYESSPLFSDAERAAMRVAQGAGHAPVECTDADFDELKKHFDDNQICEIVSVIALFGFLNKWNATLATEIESNPLAALNKLGPDAKAS